MNSFEKPSTDTGELSQVGEKISNGWPELEEMPPFNPNLFIANENYRAETKMILEDPDHRGASFDSQIIDGRSNLSPEEIYESLSSEQKDQFDIDDLMSRIKSERTDKIEKFKEYVDEFHGSLKTCRICCTPKTSPFALCNAEHPNGEVAVDNLFAEQLKTLFQSGVEDMTVVASLAHRADGELSMQLPEKEKYEAMIESLISELPEEDLSKLTIQIGNETNESIDIQNGDITTKITEKIDPKSYAEFYKSVVSSLKEKHSELKFALAGVSLMDPRYVKEVVSEIDNDDLIDKIDIHPYRSKIDEPWVPKGNAPIESYSGAEDDLLAFAKGHGAELMVGEVQLGGKPSLEERNAVMKQILNNSAEKGIKSNIWPAEGLPF